MQASTAVVVAFGVSALDLSWIPKDVPVVIVRNDDLVDPAQLPEAWTIIDSGANIGFGAAVNRAICHVHTERVVLVNPDVQAEPEHWQALASEDPKAIVSVPLVDRAGVPNLVATAYPGAGATLLMGWRLGQLFGRQSWIRRRVVSQLGHWGSIQASALTNQRGSWPLSERWLTFALVSLPTEAIRAAQGFDERYFLYFEDVDLCRRIAEEVPGAQAVVADVTPAVHGVGASGPSNPEVERHRHRSAVLWAQSSGLTWWAVRVLLWMRPHLDPRVRGRRR